VTHELALVAAACFGCSSFVAWVCLRFAAPLGLVDRPNARSMHVRPMPTGGGLAIVVGAVVGLLALAARDQLETQQVVGLSGCIAVAGLGLAADRWAVPILARLVGHLVAAAWAVWWLGGIPVLDLGLARLEWGVAGVAVALVGIAWLINLYNFMDGVDGVAGTESVVVAGLAALVYAAEAPGLSAISWVVAASTAGFLVWNWPPARVFMGDAGSGALGYLFGALVVVGAREASLWPILILLGVFIADTGVTLGTRVLRRKRFWLAHRTHAYQHATRRHGHRRVAVLVGLITLVWLGPLAWAAVAWPSAGAVLTLVALVPLVGGALALRAGRPWPTEPGG